MASSSDPRELLPQLVGDEDVEARAQRDVRDEFVKATRQWRSARAAAVNCCGYLAIGLLPAIPGSEPLFGVDWRVSLGLMLVHCLNTIVGVFVIARFHPLSLPGKAVEVFGTTWFIGSAAALIALSGSVRSVFWFNIGAIVALLVNTIHHHRRVLLSLVSCMVVLVAYFLARGQWGDAATAALFGWCLAYFQRMSTRYGWRHARERARVALMHERIAPLLVDRERKRIERELHDGVAADLTAALLRARSLEGVDRERVDALADDITKSLGELQRVIQKMRARPSDLATLSNRLEDEAHRLAGGAIPLEVTVALDDEARRVSPEVGHQVVRVLQEALRNAIAHAEATRLRVAIRAARALELVVEDDGVGLDDDALERESGGLANMRARARAIGAELDAGAAAAGGTRIRLSVPLA